MDHASVLPRRFSYDLLKEITNDFSEERKLGSGGYGKVYKGVQKDGETIAVKLLYDMPGLDDEQFEMEFSNLMCLQHKNIVRLVGYCHDTRQECVEYKGRMVIADKIHRALCFEYAHNGSLHENLSDEYHGHDWRTRYAIIKGICNGLQYMHEELKPPMYHLDLKPANILLDLNMVPKVGDFGLSRLFGQEQTKITKSSIGTCGYLPPEYIEQNVLSNKFDIFSMGVVIIKVMAGPLGYSRCADMSSREFVKFVYGNWRARLQTPPISEPEPEAYYEQVKTCIEIALSCVEIDRHKRPTIRDIVDKLNATETKIQLWSPLRLQVSSSSQSFASAVTGLRRFEYSVLAGATDNFSKDSQIGGYPYSSSYKGSYTDENGKQDVYVKEIKSYIGGDLEDFITELHAIRGTRHMNLVALKGWCSSQNIWGWVRQQKVKLFLVYEFMPNGSLYDHLYIRAEIIPWEKRYQIVKGIGYALRYLHHERNAPILHRDIKPSHVLLDYDFNAKLGGFSLTRITSKDNAALLSDVIGTMKYLDPRLKRHMEVCKFDRKTDIYSFGIVLLEIACRDKSREQVMELHRRSATEPKVMEDATDPKLCGVFDRREMERVIVLGLRCSHPDVEQRPYMVDAMKFLEDGIELPAITEEGQQGASALAV